MRSRQSHARRRRRRTSSMATCADPLGCCRGGWAVGPVGWGVVWSDVAWRGVAWRGMAWRGVAWRGVAWRGVAWRGVAWRGVAWRGVAWRRMAWHGVICGSFRKRNPRPLCRRVPGCTCWRRGGEGGHQWSGCSVRIELGPRLLPAAFIAGWPHCALPALSGPLMFVLASSSLNGLGCDHQHPTGSGGHQGQGSLPHRILISWPHSAPQLRRLCGARAELLLSRGGGRGGGGFGPKTWCTKNGLTRFSLL